MSPPALMRPEEVLMQASDADVARPPSLRIDISCPDEDTVVVAPSGEADICAVAGLRQALCDAIGSDRPHIVVDLDHLTFMDASTLGVLVAARLRTSAAGKTLQVRCCTRHGLRLLKITGLAGLLDQSTCVAIPGTARRARPPRPRLG